MDNPIISVIVVLFFVFVFLAIFYFVQKKRKNSSPKVKAKNVNEWSYQRFARFYGYLVLSDPKFQIKIDNIKKLITEDKLQNIDEIAQKVDCSLDECILKIRYLKNKRVLGDFSVDTINNKIKPCTEEEVKLLKKYSDLVYSKHYQINEIANEVPNYHNMPVAILKEDIYKDIKYLNDRMLLNGIKLNETEKTIIYYTIEKNKNSDTIRCLNCPGCGALVDVPKDGQATCSNCGSVVSDAVKE